MRAQQALSGYFLLEEKLKNLSSVVGIQLEQLQNRWFPNLQNTNEKTDILRLKFVDLSLLLKGLNPEEMRICRLRYGCRSGLRTYERVVPNHEVYRVRFPDGTMEMLTRQAETLLSSATFPTGEEIEGWVKVRGRAARRMSFEEIANDLELSERQVRQLCSSAYKKVVNALRKRVDEDRA